MSTAANLHKTTKRACEFSKPHWTKELTEMSNELRKARKNYSYRSTQYNIFVLQQAQKLFKALITTQTNDWFRKQLEDINHTKQKDFWQKTSKLLTPKTSHSIAPLLRDRHIFDEKEKAAVLKETFFSGKHLDGMKTDQMHETVVEQKLKATKYATTNTMIWCDQPFTMEELTHILKKLKVNCKAVDNTKHGSGTFRHQPFGRQYGVGHMGDKSVDQMG